MELRVAVHSVHYLIRLKMLLSVAERIVSGAIALLLFIKQSCCSIEVLRCNTTDIKKYASFTVTHQRNKHMQMKVWNLVHAYFICVFYILNYNNFVKFC